MSFNRRQFLQGSAVATASLASAFVCKAYAEPLAEIELTLAFDASGSMFGLNNEGVRNWDTQISGYVHALGQQEIIEKLVGGRVYLRTILWSDGKIHPLVFDGLIRTKQDVNRAQFSLENFMPSCSAVGCGGTNHATAIEVVLSLPKMGYMRVLDISTDEPTSTDYRLKISTLREEFSRQDGTINALAVGMEPEYEADLQKNLCTKHGFCFKASTWDDYAEALKRKIITEIA